MKEKFQRITQFFIFTGIMVPAVINAQQLPLGNQYLINGFSLSPAYAGADDNMEALLSYRKDWTGVDGSPESKLINLNGSLSKLFSSRPKVPKDMGVGATIISEEVGIFRNTSVSLSYAYKINISKVQSVRLAISAGLMESDLNISSLGSQSISDPVIANGKDIRKTVFDAGFGALYRFKNLDVGIVVPRLLEPKVKDNKAVYTLNRHYIFHASYTYHINKQFGLQPFAIVRTTSNSKLLFEAAAKLTYNDRLWMALGYRNSGAIGLSIGGALYKVVQMGYSYEFSGVGMLGKSSGTHEISLGFILGGSKPEAPASTPKKPYYDWIK